MRTIALWTAYLGLALAMVGGANWPSPQWWLVIGGLVVIGVGVVLKRRAGAPKLEEAAGTAPARVARNGTVKNGVREMVAGLCDLAGRAPDLHLEAIKSRVEDLQYLGPDRVGESQEALTARYGFAGYSEVMAPLATAERLMYRAWSAATDGHRPECLRSLREALPYAEESERAAMRVFADL